MAGTIATKSFWSSASPWLVRSRGSSSGLSPSPWLARSSGSHSGLLPSPWLARSPGSPSGLPPSPWLSRSPRRMSDLLPSPWLSRSPRRKSPTETGWIVRQKPHLVSVVSWGRGCGEGGSGGSLSPSGFWGGGGGRFGWECLLPPPLTHLRPLRWGTVDAESAENLQLSRVFSFQSRLDQIIALHALPVARNSASSTFTSQLCQFHFALYSLNM